MNCYKHACTQESSSTIQLISPGKHARLLVCACCDQHLDNWLNVQQDGSWKSYLDRSLILPTGLTVTVNWENWSLLIEPIESPALSELPKNEMHRKINIDNAVYCPWDTEVLGGDNDCDHDFDPEPSADESNYVEFTCTLCGQRVQIGVWE